MADDLSPAMPRVSPEQRRAAAGQFERANQVIVTGNLDYGIQLLLNCCVLDPANLLYRQKLRQTEKAKYKNNLKGSALAFIKTAPLKLKLKAAFGSADYLKTIEQAEHILVHNPWDIGAQLAMAKAFEAQGLRDAAIWTLEQARQADANNLKVNRNLAGLYEKRGNFTQAMALWEMVRKADPKDIEAANKAKDIAASATIARGNYEAALQAKKETAEISVEATPDYPPPLPPTVSASQDKALREAVPLQAKIQADPTNANAYLQLASVYRRADMPDQALEVLRNGLTPTAHNFEIAVELADLEIEPFRKNLTVTEQKLKTVPTDANLLRIRGELLKEINSRELNLFRLKADRYPTEMSHRFELGIRLLQAGQVDEAIKELQTARSDPRHHAKALVYLGYCFKHRKNWRLAQRNFEEALQNLPPQDESLRKTLLFQLAQGCADAGDFAKAVDFGMELANLDFSCQNIGTLLDDWQTKLQKA